MCIRDSIESVHDNWFEILRTERLDSREEAEALLAQLQSGATYTVTLDQSSEIQLAGNLTDTFRPAAGGTFTDVPATHWAAGAVAFVSSQGLLQGISCLLYTSSRHMSMAWFRSSGRVRRGGRLSRRGVDVYKRQERRRPRTG